MICVIKASVKLVYVIRRTFPRQFKVQTSVQYLEWRLALKNPMAFEAGTLEENKYGLTEHSCFKME